MATTRTEQQVRAVVYTRISNDPTGAAAGVTRQEQDCRKLAADLGWRVVSVLPDNDISAYSGKPRPGYRELLRMLADGEADAVLAWHPDRLYRQLADLQDLIKVVQATGAHIRTCRAGAVDLNTASGVMTAEILASVSKHEVAHAIERMKDKKKANRAAGVHHGGPRPFGFQPVKRRAKGETPAVPKIDEREAALLREAANAVLAHAADPETGMTLAAVCRHWNAQGVSTPRGNAWTVPSLRKTLLSARLAGLVEHRGEIIGPGQWTPILEHDVWTALRTVLTDPARRTGSGDHDGKTVRYLGSGLYRCHCGAAVRPGGARADEPQKYRCTGKGCVHRYAEPIDDFVERVIVARLARPDARAAFSGPETPATAGPSTQDLNARHATLSARLEALADAFADDDDADPAEYRAASRKLKERISAVEQQMAEAQSLAAAAREPSPLDVVDLPELARRHQADPGDALEWYRATYPLERRRKILAVLAVVTVRPGRRGRPKAGAPALDPETVDIDWTR